MLVLVDESGDCGMKFDRGSTPIFAVAAVVFEDMAAAEGCDATIGALRVELGLPAGAEFHFHRATDRVRDRFARAAMRHAFRYAVLVADKRRLRGPEFQRKETFYGAVISALAGTLAPHLTDAKAVLDDSGDREFNRLMLRRLREATGLLPTGVRAVRKAVVERSRSNNLLQLADFVVGAEARAARDGPTPLSSLFAPRRFAWAPIYLP